MSAGSSLLAGRNIHSCLVSPAMAGQVFDTARRKKATANIFADVKQDVLLKLFRKAGDLRAAERANSIVSYGNDPDRVSRALKALQQQDKKDMFTLINGLKRSSLRLH
ncbi:transcriptional and immune response regulator b [Salminus brasiliensis]|uniref:transcriptional and immune response regulator b n=1 Tax=Salminus brasiliensis TaxID=930266 RepID=UPI003B82EBFF